MVICYETQPKLLVKPSLFCLQGTRVWLRENGQHFPSTVNSCAEGVVVFRTDYGQVSARLQLPNTHVLLPEVVLQERMGARSPPPVP